MNATKPAADKFCEQDGLTPGILREQNTAFCSLPSVSEFVRLDALYECAAPQATISVHDCGAMGTPFFRSLDIATSRRNCLPLPMVPYHSRNLSTLLGLADAYERMADSAERNLHRDSSPELF